MIVTWLLGPFPKKISLKNDNLLLSMLILAAAFIFSFIGNFSNISHTQNTFLAVKSLLGNLGPFILFTIVTSAPISSSSTRKLIGFFTLIISIYTLWHFLSDWFLANEINYRFNLGIHPNASGGLIGMAFIFLIIKLNTCKSPANRFFIFAVYTGILLLSVALVLTFSRGVWIGLPITVLIVSLRHKTKNSYFLLIIWLLILFMVLFSMLPGFAERFLSIFSFSENEGRLIIWNNSLNIFRNHVLIGVGPGMFKHYFYNLVPNFSELHHQHAHNNFLQIAVEFGTIGLTAFVLLLLSILKKIRTLLSQFKGSSLESLSLVLLGWFTFWFILGLTDYSFNLTFKPVIYILMLLLALLNSKTSINKEENP